MQLLSVLNIRQAAKQQFPVPQPNKFSTFDYGLNYQPVTNGIFFY
jgi:hypothetical protein